MTTPLIKPVTAATLSFSFCLAAAALAEPAAPALPQPPLGMTCAANEEWTEATQALQAKVDAAVEATNWPAAAVAQRDLTADQCYNSYQWSRLGVFLARAGKADEALEVAAYTFARWPNETGGELTQGDDTLGELRALPKFAESRVARDLAAKKAAREERLVKARAVLAALPAATRPAEQYVAKDACPFECCTFGEWSVEAEIPLFKAPNGAALGRSLKPGDAATGLTGEVHLRPRPVMVGHEFEVYEGDNPVKVPAGTLLFELDAIGEGFSNFWWNGKVVEAQLTVYDEYRCLELSESCWGDYLDEQSSPSESQWWVKVRLKDGSEAWARDEGFGSMDGCG